MQTIVLVIHVMLAIALCGVVLLQRSEGGGLGMGGGGGASGGLGLMSGRTTANLLTRTTAILAGSFMATSILLAVLSGGSQRGSVLDRAPELPPINVPMQAPTPNFGAPAPVVPAPTTPVPGANTPEGPAGFQPTPQPAPANQNPIVPFNPAPAAPGAPAVPFGK